MANDLSAVANVFYTAANVVSHELVGAIPSVKINADPTQRVALGETVTSIYAPTPTVNTSYAPSMTIPEGDNQTALSKQMTVSQVANIKIPWTGEDIRKIENGPGIGTYYDNQIAEAFRAITNTIESYLCTKLKNGVSRWYGTAGTTPFASNFSELPQLRKILADNGCVFNGAVTCLLDTTAGANLRSLAQLNKANEAGNDTLLRQGDLLDLQGFMFKESAGIASHTKGTGANYVTNTTATYAAGTKSVAVDTGTGTVLAGDVITFAGDTNKYGVGTALTGGSLIINEPGLRSTLADGVAMTVGNSYTGNLAFHRDAVELVVRPPAMPTIAGSTGDAATDRMTVQDPYSGLVYEIALYKGYGKVMLDITTFYDAHVWEPKLVAGLLG